MFTNIKLKEVSIFAKQMNAGYTTDEGIEMPPIGAPAILQNLELIDNMLSVMKSKSLLNKKTNLKKQLDGLLALSVGDEDMVVGGSNTHLML
jgi:hypothetical protein